MPKPAYSAIGVRTSATEILERAQFSFSPEADGRAHVVVPVCAEHAADVFRGRVKDVEMAWRLG